MTTEKKEVLNSDIEFYYDNELNCNVEKKISNIDKLELEFMDIRKNDHVARLFNNSSFHSIDDQMYRKAKQQQDQRVKQNRTAHFEQDPIKSKDNLAPKIIMLYLELRLNNKVEKTIHPFDSFKDFRSYLKKLYRQSNAFKNISLKVKLYGTFKNNVNFEEIATAK